MVEEIGWMEVVEIGLIQGILDSEIHDLLWCHFTCHSEYIYDTKRTGEIIEKKKKPNQTP